MDIVLDLGGRLLPIEVKSAETMASDFFAGLEYYTGLQENRTEGGVLVHGGDRSYRRGPYTVRPWHQCS